MRPTPEPERPKVIDSGELFGEDPFINQRIRDVLAQNPRATQEQIAAELELHEWVVWRALKRIRER